MFGRITPSVGKEPPVQRVLVVHQEQEVRASLEGFLRDGAARPPMVEGAASLADGLRRARLVDPHVVFVDLTGEQALVLDSVAELRRPGRQIVGLYNPLVLRGDLGVLRVFTRAGVGDFIPLPLSVGEVRAAMASAEPRQGSASAEGQIVTFVSQQGGVGTTTLATNVAVLMAGSEEVRGPVALCDASVQFGNALAFLGLSALHDLADFVADPHGASALASCLTEEPMTGLQVLAAPRDPVAGDRITPEDLTRVLVELRRRFAWVIVDTPPVLDLMTLSVLDLSDRIFVVTEATTPILLGTDRLLHVLDEARLGGDRLRVVLNRFNSFEGNLSERTVCERLGRDVDHVVPYDRHFVVAATRGRPLVSGRPSGAVAAALSALGDDVVGRRNRTVEVA